MVILGYRLVQFKTESDVLLKMENAYLFGLLVPFAYEIGLQYLFRLDKTLPFLPLLLTSVYCSIGIIYFWIKFYVYFLGPSFFFADEKQMKEVMKQYNMKKKVK